MSNPTPDGPRKPLPSLPIVTIDPADRKSEAEKYGSFRLLAIGGLALLVALIAWFGWSAWSLRAVWRDVYILHDPSRPEFERLDAADRLSHNPDVNQRQRYDISLRRDLPDLARYLVAESLTAEAMTGDPRAYALAVARSEGWPDWLRLLHLRPLAYGAGEGEAITQEALRELAGRDDPILRLWALYTLAESSRYNADARRSLEDARSGPDGELATLLLDALDAEDDAHRVAALDAATLWLRDHHPGARAVWSGWKQGDDGFISLTDPGAGDRGDAGPEASGAPRANSENA